MRIRFDLWQRDALAAPVDKHQTWILSIVVLIVSISSALGAGWIILSFACFKSLRSFRHQLILGLAVSDGIMAINFLSSAAMNLGGKDISTPEQRAFCSYNGFMTQAFVIQTDYWVLTIAFCTYFILVDHKKLSAWVQDHRILLSCLPWLLSIIWASIGLGVVGYGNTGAWCWFTSDEVRLLANFVPRWLIIAIMLVMYTRLYWMFRQAHKQSLSFDYLASEATQPGNRPQDGNNEIQARANRPSPNALQEENRWRESSENSRRFKRLTRLMLMYPVAYMLIWMLPTAVRIYQTTKGVPAPFVVQTIDKACVVVQGFVDAVIYGINETSLSSWRNLFWPKPYPTIDGGDNIGTSALSYTQNDSAAQACPPLKGSEAAVAVGDAAQDDAEAGIGLSAVRNYRWAEA